MPQLEPFYYINEVGYFYAIIAITVLIVSIVFLPRFLRLYSSRSFLSFLAR